jgi:hypothetical protein
MLDDSSKESDPFDINVFFKKPKDNKKRKSKKGINL